jgi:hypothetical protein
MLKELKKIAKDRNIEWNDEQYEADKNWITTHQIKFYLARSIWDLNSAYASTIMDDRQVVKALDLFPFAEQIRTKKKNK